MIDTSQIRTFRDLFRIITFSDTDFTPAEVQGIVQRVIDLKDEQYRDILDEYDRAHRQRTDEVFRQWELCQEAV